MPDLDKLRRFALVVGLVLVAYGFAGVRLREGHRDIGPLGLPLEIARPELVPAAILAVSVYATFRYVFFAYLVGRSPRQRRRRLLASARLPAPRTPDGVPLFKDGVPRGVLLERRRVFWEVSGPESAGNLERDIVSLFPRTCGAEASVDDVEESWENETGQKVVRARRIETQIPLRVHLGALLQDLDYALPVLVNVLGWAAFARSAVLPN